MLKLAQKPNRKSGDLISTAVSFIGLLTFISEVDDRIDQVSYEHSLYSKIKRETSTQKT